MKLFICLVFLFISFSAWSFRVTPITAEFGIEGRERTKTFVVENPTKKDVAIQIQAFTRANNKFNKETRKRTKHFNFYPAQLSLKPGQRRSVRVTWLGNGQEGILGIELAYRLVFKQLPVNLDKKAAEKAGVSINFLYEYVEIGRAHV